LIPDGNLCSIHVRWIERVAGKASRIMTSQSTEIIEVTSQRFEELLERAASNTLRDDDMELMRQIFASYSGFFQIVGDKNTTIARLRKLMFGATTEKSKDVLGDAEATLNQPDGDSSDAGNASDSDVSRNIAADDTSATSPGHGRLGADDYPGADQVDVSHPELSPGDACPECVQGTLYEKSPGVSFALLVRLRCTRLSIACRSCAATFAENCLLHRIPPTSAMISSTTQWPV
jgi:hypothetical protein